MPVLSPSVCCLKLQSSCLIHACKPLPVRTALSKMLYVAHGCINRPGYSGAESAPLPVLPPPPTTIPFCPQTADDRSLSNSTFISTSLELSRCVCWVSSCHLCISLWSRLENRKQPRLTTVPTIQHCHHPSLHFNPDSRLLVSCSTCTSLLQLVPESS